MICNVICELTPIPNKKIKLKEGWGKCFISQSLPIAVSRYWTGCPKVVLSLKPCWCELLQNGLYGCGWTSHQNTAGSKEQQYVVRGNIWKHITHWWAPETHSSATPARSGRSPRACWAQVQPAATPALTEGCMSQATPEVTAVALCPLGAMRAGGENKQVYPGDSYLLLLIIWSCS